MHRLIPWDKPNYFLFTRWSLFHQACSGLTWLLVLLGNTGQAQPITQTVTGVVLDAQSGWALPGASVQLIGGTPEQATIADAEGTFALQQVPLGRQRLQVSHLGYRSQTLDNILVTSGKQTTVQVMMQQQVLQVQEVVVKAQQGPMLNNEFGTLSARSFDIEQTRRFAGSRNDPARMVTGFAGVASDNDSRNDIVVRGNSPTSLLWRLEGVDLFNPNHFGRIGATGGPVSMLNNNMLATSDFFTGAFPANYGNVLGGVFDIQLRTGNRQKREYTGQIGSNGFEAGAEGPFMPGKKATYLIHYRYSVLGFFKALGITLNTGTGTAVPEYQDVSFKVTLPGRRPGNRFTLFGLGGTSQISFVPTATDTSNTYNDAYANTYNRQAMGVIGASYTHYLNERTYLKTTLAASAIRQTTRQDSLNGDRAVFPYYRDNSRQYRLSISLQYNQKLNARHTMAAGLYVHQLGFRYSDSVFAKRTAFRILHDFRGRALLHQAYWQWQYNPVDAWTINAGLHGTWFGLNNSFAIEPRVAARYSLNTRQTVSLGAGLHSQLQPNPLYFYRSYSDDGSTVATNQHIGLTRSWQTVAGFEQRVGTYLRLKAETYYQFLFDVPVEQTRSSFSALNFGTAYTTLFAGNLVNQGSGRNYGLELTAERTFSRGYYFLATASLYDSRYRGSDGIWRSTAYNGHYVLNGLAGKEFQLGPRNTLSLDIRATTAGGRPYTPIDLAQSIRTGREILDDRNAFSARYKNYFRADLKLTWRRNDTRFSQEWFVDLQNILNTQNLFRQFYSSQQQRIQTQNQLGFYPNVNYRIEF